ncbi:unnamed protein product [Alopecurus aequalis]
MDSKNELQSDMQCNDRLVVQNSNVVNDVTTPENQTVTNDLLSEEKNRNVLGHAKFREVLSPTPLLESSRSNETVKWAGKASCNPCATSDTTNQQAIGPIIKLCTYLFTRYLLGEIISLPDCSEKCMASLDVSQTKSWIVRGHDCGHIDIFDYDMKKSISSATGDGRTVRVIKFVDRKRWFIVGSESGRITVYTYETTVQKITSFCAKGSWIAHIESLAVHSTQPYVLSSCSGNIQLWDWDKNWQCIRTFERQSFFSEHEALAFNRDDTNEFASADHSEIHIWNLGSLKRNYTLRGHSDTVMCLDFFKHDNNQQYLITGSSDNTVKIWDMQKRACVRTLEGFMSPVIFVGLCPSLSVFITGTKHGMIQLWNAKNFGLRRALHIGGPRDDYVLACLTGSGRVVMGTKSTLYMVDILDE